MAECALVIGNLIVIGVTNRVDGCVIGHVLQNVATEGAGAVRVLIAVMIKVLDKVLVVQ